MRLWPALSRARPGSALAPCLAIAVIVALVAVSVRIGSDARWLAALGRQVAARGSVPAGVPFAAAASPHWPNPLVAAELLFAALESALGDRGLMLAQLVAVAVGLALAARDARAGGAQGLPTAAALALAALGSITSLAIARVQLFSLILMPALVLLLRADARLQSRRIWLAVPLLAVWSNLHGGALLGLGMLFCQVALTRARRRPGESLALVVSAAAALCATPAGPSTIAYYRGVLENVAAQRGAGLWAPLSLRSPFDLLLIVCAVTALGAAARARPRIWEWAVIAALSVATVRADRNGVWLMLFLVAPAARGLMAGAPAAGGVIEPRTRRAPPGARGAWPTGARGAWPPGALGARPTALQGARPSLVRPRAMGATVAKRPVLAGPTVRPRAMGATAAALAALAIAAPSAVTAAAMVRGPVAAGAPRSLVARAVALAHGSPVLADGSIDEQVALAGGRIWAGDPIDAFPAPVQAAYLDWLAGAPGGLRALVAPVSVVLVSLGSPSQRLMAHLGGFAAVGAAGGAVLYVRTTGRLR
ncbi:MAG TPA: hypothetical protein VKV27_11265 [Solirubrobacteraceae bacterium]|nr:hypothetical protein [Solirubrobacteraceae bacterium]